jgi:hypothetical protein
MVSADRRLLSARVLGCVTLIVLGMFFSASPKSAAQQDNCSNTASRAFGWPVPNRSDDFDDPSSLDGWAIYGGPGYAGNGLLTRSAITVADGLLTITGDPEGNTGGMAWLPGQLYGRWEACVKSPPSSPNYHSVMLLWPDFGQQPIYGGEIDFMEILDPSRQTVTGSVHDRRPLGVGIPDGVVTIDATQWHSWAVEWTPFRIVGFVDGEQWFEETNPTQIPRGPMHLCIQLDNFGGDITRGGQEIVDWVRQYPLL